MSQLIVVSFDDVTIDLAAKSVSRAGERVHVTPTEWRILEFLARHSGALVTRQALLRDKKRTGGRINVVLLGDGGPVVEPREADEVRRELERLIA